MFCHGRGRAVALAWLTLRMQAAGAGWEATAAQLLSVLAEVVVTVAVVRSAWVYSPSQVQASRWRTLCGMLPRRFLSGASRVAAGGALCRLAPRALPRQLLPLTASRSSRRHAKQNSDGAAARRDVYSCTLLQRRSTPGVPLVCVRLARVH
jgi:hypothetical protein